MATLEDIRKLFDVDAKPEVAAKLDLDSEEAIRDLEAAAAEALQRAHALRTSRMLHAHEVDRIAKRTVAIAFDLKYYANDACTCSHTGNEHCADGSCGKCRCLVFITPTGAGGHDGWD